MEYRLARVGIELVKKVESCAGDMFIVIWKS